MFESIRDRIGLLKPAISLMSAAAALFGYAAHAQSIGPAGWLTALSVFMLTAGAAALNNVQDRSLDRSMTRTKGRALPSGRISTGWAFFAAASLMLAGLAGLFIHAQSMLAPFAGLAAIVLYNGLYTPLKSRFQLALAPGVVCGMMPPLIGWLSANGPLASARLSYIMILYGTWQVPHFWLIVLSYRDEYRRLRMASPLDTFSDTQIKRLIFTWSAGYAVIAPMLILYGYLTHEFFILLIVANMVLMPVVFGTALLRYTNRGGYRILFHYLNAVMAFLVTASAINIAFM